MPDSPDASHPVDAIAYPRVLEARESSLVEGRRHQAGVSNDARVAGQLPSDTVGIGLSGGGVRSATFCLGVFQALAHARTLNRVDFVSTVSGGGYFGSFLGRLFTRDWVQGVADVEDVLLGEDTADALRRDTVGWGAGVFRWLRDNGRYLAPRGSGDVLLLGALLLRNWLAVQVVLIVTMLTAFAALQLARIALERAIVSLSPAFDAAWVVCHMPLGNWLLWWSPWTVTPIIPLAIVAAPSGWAYWLVSRKSDGRQGIPAWVGAALTLVIASAGIWRYGLTGSEDHPARLTACILGAGFAVLALAFYLGGELWVQRLSPQDGESLPASGARLRTGLTNWFKGGLVASGLLLATALVDTLGQTIYAVSESGDLTAWGTTIASAFAAIGAFARPLSLLFSGTTRSRRRGVSMSTLTWIGAVVVMAVWLVSIDVGSHALRWHFNKAGGYPFGLTSKAAPTVPILGADALYIERNGDTQKIVGRMDERPACSTSPAVPEHPLFLAASFAVLAAFTYLFGQTRRFANLSSVHGFYTARLTRTFLGASNDVRLSTGSSGVSDTVHGDDCAGDAYWRWPRPPEGDDLPPVPPGISRKCWEKGGPLHIVNTTINETVDGRSGIQNQSRKGIGLAVGPCGLSVGVRHHLVVGDDGWRVFPSDADAHHVFKSQTRDIPEPLSLGRWMSISGAAFSAAAGANTTVPLALLCGMFNVRMGYWWDSGTGYDGRWWEQLLPVQSAFFAEMLARTHGTAGQLWNISDGGHFENMGGYELIRRRLPIIVIIDAEADPDYNFEGLSGMVRKARLDFRAEIVFLNAFELDGLAPDSQTSERPSPLPESVRAHFGDLDALRRGTWQSEDLTNVHGMPDRRFNLSTDRSKASKAHAALARVVYGDPRDPNARRSWLVYVKATLTGDEPEDVGHYHRGHEDFPQESTLDQFFDEAQWESYRRLGQHIGHDVLRPELFEYLARTPA